MRSFTLGHLKLDFGIKDGIGSTFIVQNLLPSSACDVIGMGRGAAI